MHQRRHLREGRQDLAADVRGSASTPRTRLMWLLAVVTNLEGGAAVIRAPGTVRHARGATGILACNKGLVEAQIDEAAFDDEYLFPEIVSLNAHGRGVRAGREVQHTSVVARLGVLAENALGQAVDAAHSMVGNRVSGCEELELRLRHASLLAQILMKLGSRDRCTGSG